MEKQIENKLETVIEKLARREQLRQEDVIRKRAEMDVTKAESEKADYFRATIAEKSNNIAESLNALTLNDNKADLPVQFDKICEELTSLQKYIGVSTLFLTAYDARRSQEQAQELELQYRQLKDQLLPKKKFGFKSRKICVNKQEKDGTDVSQASKPLSPMIKKFEHLYINHSTGFANKKGESLCLTHEDVFRKDISLTSLEDCTIQLTGTSSTLHIMSLKNCMIFSGPVATSVFIEDCTGCKFQVPCQQLRVHNTQNCDFYLHVKSRAIIEDTTQVRFAPYNWSYDDIDTHFELAGLDMNTNHWDSIDDFNWLASDKPSPNWHVMNDAERITDWKLNGNTN